MEILLEIWVQVILFMDSFHYQLIIFASDTSLFSLESMYLVMHGLHSFENATKQFSTIISGSFSSSYDFLHPIPIIRQNQTCGFSRLLPRIRLNAESIHHWFKLYPYQMVSLCILKILISYDYKYIL